MNTLAQRIARGCTNSGNNVKGKIRTPVAGASMPLSTLGADASPRSSSAKIQRVLSLRLASMPPSATLAINERYALLFSGRWR